MIKTVKGDLLDSPDPIIVHQVNCKGVMGSGVALAIRKKYPNVYEAYKQVCREEGDKFLGECLIMLVEDGKYVANLFGQKLYGREKIQYTEYDALEKAFKKLAIYAKDNNMDISMPYNISCGLAGGSWPVVYDMIIEVFEGINVTLYRKEGLYENRQSRV